MFFFIGVFVCFFSLGLLIFMFRDMEYVRNLRRLQEFKNCCSTEWILTRGKIKKTRKKYIAIFSKEKDSNVFATCRIIKNKIPEEEIAVWYNSQTNAYYKKKKTKLDEQIFLGPNCFKPCFLTSIETNYGDVVLELQEACTKELVDVYKNPFTLEYSLDIKPKFIQEEKFLSTIPVEIKKIFIDDEKMKKICKPVKQRQTKEIVTMLASISFFIACLLSVVFS